MDQKRLSVVIIGTGGWAQEHARAIRDVEQMELVGVVGHSNQSMLDSVAVEFGVKVSLDAEQMIRKLKPDVLDIACNPHYRLEGIKLACKYGVKTVNIEKPMALSLDEGREIYRLCSIEGIKLTINHQKKFMTGWCEAAELLGNEELGKTHLLWATCRGNILEQGTHLIDMALFFNQYSRPQWVVGQIGELEGLQKYSASAPDMAFAEMCLANGVRNVFEFGTLGHVVSADSSKWMHMGIDVFGEKGRLHATLNDGCTVEFFDDRKPIRINTLWERDFQQGLVKHFEQLVEYSRGQTDHISNMENSLLSFELVMGIFQSALSLSCVKLPTDLKSDVVDKLSKYGDCF